MVAPPLSVVNVRILSWRGSENVVTLIFAGAQGDNEIEKDTDHFNCSALKNMQIEN